jgi:Xaa-Pro aminopeptidase
MEQVRALVAGARSIAMQHSPQCAIPYVAMVDAGTVEMVRGLGVEVVSSANLVQLFEARWTTAQFEAHMEAGRRMDKLRADAFDFVRLRLLADVPTSEWDVRAHLLEQFTANGMVTDHGPIVAVNSNASDPHYEPSPGRHAPIRHGDLLLIDMWAKLDHADGVYYDITWTAYCGAQPPDAMLNVFEVVTGARDRGIQLVIDAAATNRTLRGFEVDDVVRAHIETRGFGNYFIHRTGHSIGADVHGSGANMDNFETHDERRIVPRTCFSIEPGIYLPEFGIRSEVNVYVGDGFGQVTGEAQRELLRLN